MNIMLMGVAGSGKGTMAAKLLEKYDIPHISTGNMFRAAIAAQTESGKLVQSYIESGILVPDEVTIAMVEERLKQDDCLKGYLLDGFPRTLLQAEVFEFMAAKINHPVQAVINLTVQLEDLAPRITGRRTCEKCGQIYNIHNLPSKVEGICDVCGGNLKHRKDDTIEQLTVRLKEHETNTKPVLAFYRKHGLVHDVDASRAVDVVFNEIDAIVEKFR